MTVTVIEIAAISITAVLHPAKEEGLVNLKGFLVVQLSKLPIAILQFVVNDQDLIFELPHEAVLAICLALLFDDVAVNEF